MCIFRHLYDFVQIGGGARFLNLQAKSECWNFVGLMPMLFIVIQLHEKAMVLYC
jgi:hypothetical protein